MIFRTGDRHRMDALFRIGLWAGICGIFVGTTVTAADLDLRLRIVWGEGAPQAWRATVRISEGELSEVERLSYEADAAGSMTVQPTVVRLWQRSESTFDGVDLRVQAPRNAVLFVELHATAAGAERQLVSTPLAAVAADRAFRMVEVLDGAQNRVEIRRQPGDELRVDFDRDSLVFSPLETWELTVRPQHLAEPAGTRLRADLHLHGVGEGGQIVQQQEELEVQASGHTQPWGPVQVKMPARDGVYELTVTLSIWKFLRYSPLVQRKLQLVVVDGKPRVGAPRAPSELLATEWKDVDTVKLHDPTWWKQWSPLPLPKVPGALPKVPLVPGVPGVKPGPLGKEHLSEREHEGVRYTELQDWVAAPLPIVRIGQPHLLEIEYPNDIPQTVGVSIVELNAAGEVRPLGLDAGWDVPTQPRPEAKQVETYQLLFWPQTKSPWVVLTNRRAPQAAVFGRIRVRAGPLRLPPAPVVQRPDQAGPQRLLAAYYDKPLFPENLSVPDALDPAPGRLVQDWTKFYLGAQRLVEYLQHAGYNGAVISVARDGGTLYPSAHWETNLRYDNGRLASSGQDARKKDVLELLFRLFDREGLTLVPAIEFATPLPELERILANPLEDAEGIELTELDADGTQRTGRLRAQHGRAAYYNPLHPRVQQAMGAVVEELCERYGGHPSFGGLAIQMQSDGYTQFPSTNWGLDDQTVRQFSEATELDLPSDGPDRFEARFAYIRSAGLEPWLEWRSRELAKFYDGLQGTVGHDRPDARLYLATADLLKGWSVRYEMRPRLLQAGSFAEAMRRYGVDSQHFAERPGVVLLRSQRIAPLHPIASQSLNLAIRQASEVDLFFQRAASHGTLSFHESQRLKLPAFEAVSPFGAQRTTALFESHMIPAGDHNRARFTQALARSDAPTLIDGGWVAPRGQEASVRDLFLVYQQLPRVPFETVPAAEDATSSVVLRTAKHAGRTFFYAINDAPWPVKVLLHFDADCGLAPLGKPFLQPERVPHGTPWLLSLKPYDLVGFVLEPPATAIEKWEVQVDEGRREMLRESIRDVAARINGLREPEALTNLINPDFELPASPTEIPGWQYARHPGVSISTVPDDRITGGQVLRMVVSDPKAVAWVRSERLPLPTTGRITIQALARTPQTGTQPPLRFSVDLLTDGRTEQKILDPYRYAPLGRDVDRFGQPTGKEVPALPTAWSETPFLAQIDDLPVQGATHLTIGFDLMGPGEVWIDEVRVYTSYFQVSEQRELLKQVATANAQLERGKLIESQRYLESYWPRFLLEQIPAQRRLAQSTRPTTLPASTTPDRSITNRAATPATGDQPSATDRSPQPQPAAGRPLTGRPFTGRTLTGQPSNGRSAAGQPAAGQPVQDQPPAMPPGSERAAGERPAGERPAGEQPESNRSPTPPRPTMWERFMPKFRLPFSS